MRVVGVDIGGTFTDLMLYDTASGSVAVHKLRSTPDDPGRALVQGVGEICDQAGIAPDDVSAVFHGTTIATNAVLQHRGAETGMITTKAFRDIVHIGRHQRPQHYSIVQDIPWQAQPFVRRRHRKVVSERIAPPTGEVLEPLDEAAVRAAARELREAGIEAVAVCFLHSYLDPTHERRAAEIVAEEMPGTFVTASADIFPQFREFERFTTATMNAFVGPATGSYLARIEGTLAEKGVPGKLHVMMSNGGVASAAQAARKPVTLLLSGPAAGVLGALWAGDRSGRKRLISFDMGGTSADIGIVTERGVIEASARDTEVAGYPLLVPMIDVHTIGAGGGSIAYVDGGGAFRVGPRSAGASPGPAAYGSGGSEPTVTDANVVLGRIDPQRFLGGEMQLDREAAVGAVQNLADRLGLGLLETAEGVITIVDAGMAAAIRSRTIQKGHDPRDFTLVALGGAGPLHAASLADMLGVPEVLVPPFPGITAAMGLLTSDLKYDQMRTAFMTEGGIDAARLDRELAEMEAELRAVLARDGVPESDVAVAAALDCRYVGQGYELRVPLPDARYSPEALDVFHSLHEQEYGHASRDPIEIVNLRVTASGRRQRLESLPVGSGTLAEATLGDGEAVFRDSSGALRPFPTRLLRPGPVSPRHRGRGPGDRLPARHDHPRPARLARHRRRLGQPPPPSMSTLGTRVDPVTAAVIGGALESIATEMGHKLARMSYSSIIRESEDFGCVICDAARPAALRVGPVDAAAVGADPRLRPRDQPALRRARRRVEARRRRHPQPFVLRRLAPARRRLRRPDLLGGRADRILGHDRPPPRPRRTDAGQLRHRRRDRRLRRGPAAQRRQDRGGGPPERLGVADPSRQRARRRSRRRRHGGTGRGGPHRRRAVPRPRRALRARDRPGRERRPDGLLRAHAAARDRGTARRHLLRRGLPRRVRRPPRPRVPESAREASP